MSASELSELTSAVTDFGATVVDLKHKRMRLTYALWAVVIVMAAFFAYFAIIVLPKIDDNAQAAKRATSETARLKESDRNRCLSGNEFRQADKDKWEYLISISPPPRTAEQMKRLNDFKAFIERTDALKKC